MKGSKSSPGAKTGQGNLRMPRAKTKAKNHPVNTASPNSGVTGRGMQPASNADSTSRAKLGSASTPVKSSSYSGRKGRKGGY